MIVKCVTKTRFGRDDTYVVGPDEAVEAVKILCAYKGLSSRRRQALEALGVKFEEVKSKAKT